MNKLSQNFEENKVAVEEKIENDYFTMTLENIARDSAYIILEYKIDLTDKALEEFGEITYNDTLGYYAIGPAYQITLNGESDPFTITSTEKISDTEYSYYQIINIMTYDDDTLDLNIWFQYLWTKNYMNETVPINELFQITTKLDNMKMDENEKQEQELDDGSKLILDKVVNTNFQTFVRIKRIVDNVTKQEYEDSTSYQYKSFLITDDNDNLIPYRTYTSDVIGEKYYSEESGESLDITDIDEEEKIRV